MRHRKKFNHLGRKSAHRKSMLSNMACSLIEHKRIKTTLAKAKALRIYVEPLITKSKNDTTHSRRIVFRYLKQKNAVTELFGDISSKIMNRNGGYTRIIKIGNRMGDNANMAYIELVDYNELYTTVEKPKKKKTRRRSKSVKVDSQSKDLESKIVEKVSDDNRADSSVEKKEVKEDKSDSSVEKKEVKEDKTDSSVKQEDLKEDKADSSVKQKEVKDDEEKKEPNNPIENKDKE